MKPVNFYSNSKTFSINHPLYVVSPEPYSRFSHNSYTDFLLGIWRWTWWILRKAIVLKHTRRKSRRDRAVQKDWDLEKIKLPLAIILFLNNYVIWTIWEISPETLVRMRKGPINTSALLSQPNKFKGSVQHEEKVLDRQRHAFRRRW